MRDLSRRTFLTTATVAAAVPLLPAAPATAATWVLKWSPDPLTDGLAGFEGLEDDRTNSHPGVKHIYVSDGVYRFDMHHDANHIDVDTPPDRQRNESKGMRTSNGTILKIGKDQTWRVTYSLFVPNTLDATDHFTHIMQMKVPDVDAPLITMSLHQHSGVPKIELRTTNDAGTFTEHSPVDLLPLQDKWIDLSLELKASDGGKAYLRWILKDGSRTVVDVTKTGLDLWRGTNYLRQKWGIYRSLQSAGLQTTFQLIKNLKAFQLQ